MLQRVLCTAAVLGAVAMPASADAAGKTAGPWPDVAVVGYTLPTATYRGVTLDPTLTTGPSHVGKVKVTVTVKHGKKTKTKVKFVTETIQSNDEWLVVSSRIATNVVSVSTTGTFGSVATSLLPPGNLPGAAIGTLPTYGSVEADGYVWLLDYSVSPAPLYAVGRGGAVHLVASLNGDFTGLTASGNTLEATDNSGFIDKCVINKGPAAACTPIAVPTTIDGGQVDAIGTVRDRVWFTDDAGELANFRPVTDRFAGPFGDRKVGGVLTGEASSDPGTLTTSDGGYLYLAGGQDTDALFDNDQILKINPGSGHVMRSYSDGLTDVVALTGASDGNVWFVDQTNTSTGAGRIGLLDTKAGWIHEYNLPRGYRLPAVGAAIAAGPVGSETVFFTLQTISGGHAAVGEVSGIGPGA